MLYLAQFHLAPVSAFDFHLTYRFRHGRNAAIASVAIDHSLNLDGLGISVVTSSLDGHRSLLAGGYMKIFLSVAGPDRPKAEEVAVQLRADDHQVFLDEDALAAGQGFNRRIREGIARADLVVFFVSSHSLQAGRYTLTELRIIQDKWPNPSGRVLPVLVGQVDPKAVPAYLGAVKLCKPTGNIGGTVAYEVSRMAAALEGQKRPPDRNRSPATSGHSFMLRPEVASSVGRVLGSAGLALLASLVAIWTSNLGGAFTRWHPITLATFNGVVLALLLWLAALLFQVRSIRSFAALGAGALAACLFELFSVNAGWFDVHPPSNDAVPYLMLGCAKALIIAGFAGAGMPQFRDITRWGALGVAGAISGLFLNFKPYGLPVMSFSWEALVVLTLALLLSQDHVSQTSESSPDGGRLGHDPRRNRL